MQFPSSAADCDCRPQVCQLNYCYELSILNMFAFLYFSLPYFVTHGALRARLWREELRY